MSDVTEIELELAELDRNIEIARAVIKVRDDLQQLRKNGCFKNVIEKAYLEEEAQRINRAKVQPLHPDALASLERMGLGIGCLDHFFMEVERRGLQAEADLVAFEQAREEFIAEDMGEGYDYE